MFTCACTAILHEIVMRAQIWQWNVYGVDFVSC